MANLNIYRTGLWSVQLPIAWVATEEPHCVRISGGHAAGALQISAAEKQHDIVTDADLVDFAKERLGREIVPQAVSFPAFSGLYAEHNKNGVFWREWWLRSGRLMLYVTYNIDEAFRNAERGIVDEIVTRLEPIT